MRIARIVLTIMTWVEAIGADVITIKRDVITNATVFMPLVTTFKVFMADVVIIATVVMGTTTVLTMLTI